MARRTLIQESRRKRPSEKATYHEIEGAGRSRVKREFFSLNDADVEAVYARVDQGLQRALKKETH